MYAAKELLASAQGSDLRFFVGDADLLGSCSGTYQQIGCCAESATAADLVSGKKDLSSCPHQNGTAYITALRVEFTYAPTAHCDGSATPCYLPPVSLYATSCNAQDGCFWDSSTNACIGAASGCSSYNNPSKCDDQAGCTWKN